MMNMAATLKENVTTTVIRAIAFILFIIGLPLWFKFEDWGLLNGFPLPVVGLSTLSAAMATLLGLLLLIGSYWLQHTSQHIRAVAIFFITIQAVNHLLIGLFLAEFNPGTSTYDIPFRNGTAGTCICFTASVNVYCHSEHTSSFSLCRSHVLHVMY